MKLVCYCDQVSEEDILRAMQQGASTVPQVIRATGAMTHCNCKVNHPEGR